MLKLVHFLFAGNRVQEQALSGEHGLVFVLKLGDLEGLSGSLEKLQVCAASLLETEVNGGVGFKGQ